MARLYNAQAVTANGIALGGLTQISVESTFRQVLEGRSDGYLGLDALDRYDPAVTGSITSQDNTIASTNNKGLDLLLTAPANTGIVAYWQNSGAATFTKYTIGGQIGATFDYVHCKFTGCNMNFGPDYSSWTCPYETYIVDAGTAGDNAGALSDLIETTDNAASAPTLTAPARLQRPKTMTLGALTPKHISALTINIQGDPVLRDHADVYMFNGAVDIAGWKVGGSITLKDVAVASGSSGDDMPMRILKASPADLVVTLQNIESGADKTVTITNVKFIGAPRSADSRGYLETTMDFVALWSSTNTLGAMVNFT
jgi:hypothetical protein